MSEVDLERLFESPEYFLFGWNDDVTAFARMTRESYAASIFTDQRIRPAENRVFQVPTADVLASPAASYVTGQIVGVDGGLNGVNMEMPRADL